MESRRLIISIFPQVLRVTAVSNQESELYRTLRQKAPDQIYPLQLLGLESLKPTSRDKLYFFSPEAEWDYLKELLEDYWHCEVELANYQGFRSLLERIINLILSPRVLDGYRVVINLTSGPEEFTPLASLLWGVFSLELLSEFPGGNQLYFTPPSPFKLKEEKLLPYFSFFARLEREGVLEKGEINPAETPELSALLEERGEKLTFTLLGFLVWKKLWLDYPPAIPSTSRIPLDKDHLTEPGGGGVEFPAGFERLREILGWQNTVEDFWYKGSCLPDEMAIEITNESLELCYKGVVLKIKTTASHPRHYLMIKEELKSQLFR